MFQLQYCRKIWEINMTVHIMVGAVAGVAASLTAIAVTYRPIGVRTTKARIARIFG
jgi:hypothetical protein